jgi:hypothetical protein
VTITGVFLITDFSIKKLRISAMIVMSNTAITSDAMVEIRRWRRKLIKASGLSLE